MRSGRAERELTVAEREAAEAKEFQQALEKEHRLAREARNGLDAGGDAAEIARVAAKLEADKQVKVTTNAATAAREAWEATQGVADVSRLKRVGQIVRDTSVETFGLSLLALPVAMGSFMYLTAPKGESTQQKILEAYRVGSLVLLPPDVRQAWNQGHYLQSADRFLGVSDAIAATKLIYNDPKKFGTEAAQWGQSLWNFGKELYSHPKAAHDALNAATQAANDASVVGAVRNLTSTTVAGGDNTQAAESLAAAGLANSSLTSATLTAAGDLSAMTAPPNKPGGPAAPVPGASTKVTPTSIASAPFSPLRPVANDDKPKLAPILGANDDFVPIPRPSSRRRDEKHGPLENHGPLSA